MKIYCAFEIDCHEVELKLVTLDENKALDLLQDWEYGYIQVFEDEEFIYYYKLDDGKVGKYEPSRFYC